MARGVRRSPRGNPAVRVIATIRRNRSALLAGTALQATTLLVLSLPARSQPAVNAHPMGGVVSAGNATLTYGPGTTTITQSSQRAAVNWQSFNVGAQETVNFRQPSSSSSTLNRVLSPDPSQIAGRINANGQVALINQSGVIFAHGAQVNTAGLIVSAAGMSDANFMAGRMAFDHAAKPNAVIINNGRLTVSQAGLAALVAPQVKNAGVITAKLGHVVLAGAKTATLDLYGDGLVSLDVNNEVTKAPLGPDGKPVTALVTNTGVIRADGGTVQLTAREADGLVQNLVEAGGRITAPSVGARRGEVVLGGLGGSVVVSGTVTADGSAAGTAGGSVQVAASEGVTLASRARVGASGSAGGGTVAIGTTLARANGGPGTPAALTAKRVTIAQGARIRANARVKGHGGRVTVLAGEATDMSGSIAARGGARGGDGGFVEVSGNMLSLTGTVDTSAPLGATGTLLLDPFDLWISDAVPTVNNVRATPINGTSTSGAFTIGQNDPPVAADSESWVSVATLNSLASNTNISLAATNNINVATSAADPTGRIRVTNALNLGTNTLTLSAGNSLTIDTGFTINAGAITLTAGSGAITLGGSSGVTGDLITTDQLAALSPTSLQTASGPIVMQAKTTLTDNAVINSAGSVLMEAGGTVSALNSITAAGDILLATGGAGPAAPAPPTATGPGLIDVEAGVTSISGSISLLAGGTGSRIALSQTTTNETGVVLESDGPGQRVTLQADQLDFLSGTSVPRIQSDVIELAPATAGTPVTLIGQDNNVVPAAGFFVNQEMVNNVFAGTLRIGAATVNGANVVSAGSIVVTGGAVDLSDAAPTLDLEAVGPITEAAASATTVGGSLANLATLTARGTTVTLDDPANSISNLGNVSASSFVLADSASPFATSSGLTVSGSVGASTISITDSAITGIQIASGATLGQPGAIVTLTSAGPITEASDATITAASLTGSSVGNTSLNGTANAIGSLGAFAANPGDFELSDTGALSITGPVTATGSVVIGGTAGSTPDSITLADGGSVQAGQVSLTSGGGGITLASGAALGQSGATIALTSTGAVSESAGATMTAQDLSGTATRFDLASPTNAISVIDGLAATGGDITVVDATDLTLVGTESGDNLFFEVAATGGTLSLGVDTKRPIPATLSAASGDRISLVADTVTEHAGSTVAAPGGSVELAPFSAINTSLLGSNGLVIDAALLDAISAGTLVIGAFTNAPDAATTPTASASSVSIDGPVGLTGPVTSLGLFATGGITQPGGALAVNTLFGDAGTVTLNNAGNDIATLGRFTATTASFDLADNGNPGMLSVTGPLSAATDLTLNTSATGGLTTTGTIGASGTLAITAGSDGIALTGPAKLSAAAVDLVSAGGITEDPGATLSTGRLTVTGGSVDLGGSANTVAALGDVSAQSFTLNDATDLLISATLDATNVALRAPQSQITLADGATIETGGIAQAQPGPLSASEEPSNGAPGTFIEAANFTQAGTSSVTGVAGGPATLQISVTGRAQFDPPLGLDAPTTWLILDLGSGTASGDMFVDALNVIHGERGSATLAGSIRGDGGSDAATLGFDQPISAAYTFNGCEIGALACGGAPLGGGGSTGSASGVLASNGSAPLGGGGNAGSPSGVLTSNGGAPVAVGENTASTSGVPTVNGCEIGALACGSARLAGEENMASAFGALFQYLAEQDLAVPALNAVTQQTMTLNAYPLRPAQGRALTDPDVVPPNVSNVDY